MWHLPQGGFTGAQCLESQNMARRFLVEKKRTLKAGIVFLSESTHPVFCYYDPLNMETNHFAGMIWVTDMVLPFPFSPHVASTRLCPCCSFHLWCLLPLASVKFCLSSKALVQLLLPFPQQANCVCIYNPCSTRSDPTVPGDGVVLPTHLSLIQSHVCQWTRSRQ